MNQVCLIGRLGQDPELRYTQGGTAVAKFSIAINRIGGPDKVTDWFDITAFGKVAESLSNRARQEAGIATISLAEAEDMRRTTLTGV